MEQNKDQSGAVIAWMRPDEIDGLLAAAQSDSGARQYGHIYAKQYDPDMVPVCGAAVRGEAVAGLPARRFVHVSGFLDADYIDFKAGEIFGGGVLNGVEYESKHYTRTVAEQFVAEGDWREVEVSARAADAPSEPSIRLDRDCELLTMAQVNSIRDTIKPGDGWDGDDWDFALANAVAANVKSRAADALDSQPTAPNNYHDAYRGARDDLADWKRRALSAEESCRKMAAAINAENGPTFMGEPASSQPTDGGVRNG